MKPDRSQIDEDYVEAIKVMEKTVKFLDQLGLDAATTRACRKIVAHLRDRGPDEVRRIMGAGLHKRSTPLKTDPAPPSLSDAEIGALSRDQIVGYLADMSLARDFLERIATHRFGVTTGALSTLRTKDALREKVMTLLDHERTHDAIARAASAGRVSESRK